MALQGSIFKENVYGFFSTGEEKRLETGLGYSVFVGAVGASFGLANKELLIPGLAKGLSGWGTVFYTIGLKRGAVGIGLGIFANKPVMGAEPNKLVVFIGTGLLNRELVSTFFYFSSLALLMNFLAD